jgi:hypothetical protein
MAGLYNEEPRTAGAIPPEDSLLSCIRQINEVVNKIEINLASDSPLKNPEEKVTRGKVGDMIDTLKMINKRLWQIEEITKMLG